MYATFLFIHSIIRWFALLGLFFTLATHLQGLLSKRSYNHSDHIIRNIGKGLTELQLLIGFVLYFLLSPTVQSFFRSGISSGDEGLFFGIYHIVMMFVAVAVLSVGNGMTKKAQTDREKFKKTLIFFSVALLLILAAIPWFRPLLRNF
ncbi:MAG: hypothetical protein MUE81_15650 [Thermoflexibacter sp.]|jgi:hypothetical protein|nr:hypothetical protein [Thermoflexibacter sp.]